MLHSASKVCVKFSGHVHERGLELDLLPVWGNYLYYLLPKIGLKNEMHSCITFLLLF